MARPISIIAIFKDGWRLYRKYFWPLVTVTAFSLLASSGFEQILGITEDTWDYRILVSGVFGFTLPFLIDNSLLLYLDSKEHGQMAGVDDVIKRAVARWWPSVIVSVIIFVMWLVGLVFLVVPGIIIGAIWFPVFYYVVLEGKKSKEAFSLGTKLTERNRLRLCLLEGLFVILLVAQIFLGSKLPVFPRLAFNVLINATCWVGSYAIWLALKKANS